LREFVNAEGNLAIRLCGRLEQEISQLSAYENEMFLEEYHFPQ